MKTVFFKKGLPVAVVAIAIAGAFSTNAMNRHAENVAIVPGYEQLNPQATECEQKDDCSTINTGTLCTVGYDPEGAQLFDKNAAGECRVTLYRP